MFSNIVFKSIYYCVCVCGGGGGGGMHILVQYCILIMLSPENKDSIIIVIFIIIIINDSFNGKVVKGKRLFRVSKSVTEGDVCPVKSIKTPINSLLPFRLWNVFIAPVLLVLMSVSLIVLPYVCSYNILFR